MGAGKMAQCANLCTTPNKTTLIYTDIEERVTIKEGEDKSYDRRGLQKV
jgi:hypothetical protein